MLSIKTRQAILCFIWISNRTELCAAYPSGFAPSLTAFLLRFAIRGRWEISSPHTPCLGICPQTPSLLRAYPSFFLRIAYFRSHGSFLCVKNKQLAEFRHSAGCFFYTIPDNRYVCAFLICPASTCNAGSGSRHRRFHPCRTGRCAWASPAQVQPSCEPYSSRERQGTCRTPSG